jgi:hypothetical protein
MMRIERMSARLGMSGPDRVREEKIDVECAHQAPLPHAGEGGTRRNAAGG